MRDDFWTIFALLAVLVGMGGGWIISWRAMRQK